MDVYVNTADCSSFLPGFPSCSCFSRLVFLASSPSRLQESLLSVSSQYRTITLDRPGIAPPPLTCLKLSFNLLISLLLSFHLHLPPSLSLPLHCVLKCEWALLSPVYELAQRWRVLLFQVCSLVRQAGCVIPGPPRTSLHHGGQPGKDNTHTHVTQHTHARTHVQRVSKCLYAELSYNCPITL